MRVLPAWCHRHQQPHMQRHKEGCSGRIFMNLTQTIIDKVNKSMDTVTTIIYSKIVSWGVWYHSPQSCLIHQLKGSKKKLRVHLMAPVHTWRQGPTQWNSNIITPPPPKKQYLALENSQYTMIKLGVFFQHTERERDLSHSLDHQLSEAQHQLFQMLEP